MEGEGERRLSTRSLARARGAFSMSELLPDARLRAWSGPEDSQRSRHSGLGEFYGKCAAHRASNAVAGGGSSMEPISTREVAQPCATAPQPTQSLKMPQGVRARGGASPPFQGRCRDHEPRIAPLRSKPPALQH